MALVSVLYIRLGEPAYSRKRFKLRKSKDYSKLWINADESIEVRNARSMLRVAASNARQSECVVQQKHSEISIGGIRYGLHEVDQIPKEYLVCPPQGRPLNPKGKQLKDGVPQTTVDTPRGIAFNNTVI